MKLYPETKDEMKVVLRDLMSHDALWHLDDDPDEISGVHDGQWRRALVDQMNFLWRRDVPPAQRHLCNVAAWMAFEECCPEVFEETSGVTASFWGEAK